MESTTVVRRDRPTVHISVRESAPTGDATVRALADLLADVLVGEQVDRRAEVGLHLVDEGEMTSLNRQHMGIDSPTDVLSFPVDGAGVPSDPSAPAARGSASGSGTAPTLVGDVVLCAAVAQRNAPGHAGSFDSELRLLVVHSALHLCGWDHDTSEGRGAMWERERFHMERLGVTPPRDPWDPS
ncbi:MAG: rRNA maturation RNase YbeY [Microthrixaceae bacterium]